MREMLQSLAGSAVEDLNIYTNPGLGQEAMAGGLGVLQELCCLITLTLAGCHLRRLPQELTALGRLRELHLPDNYELGDAGHAAFDPLASLSGLTLLNLGTCTSNGACWLRRLPAQLSALSSLAVLSVEDNKELGESIGWPGRPLAPAELEAAWERLGSLGPSLTRLDASRCALHSVPPVFSALSALVVVDLQYNRFGWEAAEAETILQPLAGLAALTKVNLRSVLDVGPTRSQLAVLLDIGVKVLRDSSGDTEPSVSEFSGSDGEDSGDGSDGSRERGWPEGTSSGSGSGGSSSEGGWSDESSGDGGEVQWGLRPRTVPARGRQRGRGRTRGVAGRGQGQGSRGRGRCQAAAASQGTRSRATGRARGRGRGRGRK